MTKVDYAARVHAGSALLDQVMPGWHNKIDTSILNIRSGAYCVLGQLYGGYFNGVEILFGSRMVDEPVHHGFAALLRDELCSPRNTEEFRRDIYAQLDKLWAAQIELRRETDTIIVREATKHVARVQDFLEAEAINELIRASEADRVERILVSAGV